MTTSTQSAATATPTRGRPPVRRTIRRRRANHKIAREGIPHVDQLTTLKEVAAREERTRLAREMLDSLSQTLYGIALGAQMTHTLLERDVSQARQANDYVRSLAAAALAELRALIFALPPASLESEGLTGCLRNQAHALSAVHSIPVATRLCDEPPAPMPVKEAMYRIAREALHNALKHARAKQVELWLEQTDGALLLEVRDDGIGFDTGGTFPGHLGLYSMEERATRLGGTFTVESAPGCGTRIHVRIPGPPASWVGTGTSASGH